MSGSTIDINGMSVTIVLANFTEANNFDFVNEGNWSPEYPSVIEQNIGDGNYILVEADIDLPGIEGEGPGPITNPYYAVTIAPGEAGVSSGLLIPVAGATLFDEGYLEIDWVAVQNMGNITISPGATLQADVPIGNTILSAFVGGLTEVGGTLYNTGTINSGNTISGGVFVGGGPITEAPQGVISYNTTLEDLTFEGDLALTQANYNVVNLVSVTFGDYAGVAPQILLNGTGGVLQSTGDQTLANVDVIFGSSVGTIASRGTNNTLVIAPTTTLALDNTDFYVANTDTLINQIELDSDQSNQNLSFSGQAFIEVIVNPNNGIYVPMAAGVFENEDSIVLSDSQAANTIFDIGFTNEAGALLSVTNAVLGDHQFTSTFENGGSYYIGPNGTVEAYDQSFINDAGGIIEIGANASGAGTLSLGTLDIQSGGKVFTTQPSTYVNNGLIELDTTVPPASSAAPMFYIGAGTTFNPTGGMLFTNNGTIALDVGVFNIQPMVTIDGGTIVGNGATIFAQDSTIENATLSGEVNLATQAGNAGIIWLYDDTFVANAFSSSTINVGAQNISLFLRDDFGLDNVVLNLGTTSDPRTSLYLESTILTIAATSTLNIDASTAYITNGVILPSTNLQTTLYNAGVMRDLSGVLDLSTTGFENAGQFTIDDNVTVNLIGASATNMAGGQITIDNGAELSVGNLSETDAFTNAGGITVEDGGYIAGLITLTANDPLEIQSGGIMIGATIVGGTIAGDGALAWGTDVLYGVLYAGALNVAGTVTLENGGSFIAAGGANLPATVNITNSAIGGGTELAFHDATTLTDTDINIGNVLGYGAFIGANAAVTFAAGVTVAQTNTYAGIDSDNGVGSFDNRGLIEAEFLNGGFTVSGLTNFTNDGEIDVSNGETFDITSAFTEAAGGTLKIAAGAEIEFGGGVSLAANAVVTLAAGSTLNVAGGISGGTVDLNGADISGSSLPGGGVVDGVTIIDTPSTISGTVTFINVTYEGSPVVGGDLLLGVGDTFEPDTIGGATPVFSLIAGVGTLDFITSQTIDNVGIDFGTGGAATPAVVMAGSGATDVALTLGASVSLSQNGGAGALLRGTSDDLSTIDNKGSIAANLSNGGFAVQSLAGFTNDGGITVSNGDDFVVGAPFTENADGSFTVEDPGTLTVNSGMTIASGATVTLDPSSQIVLGDVMIQGAADQTSALLADGADFLGTGEITGVAVLGSPTIAGDLQLGAGDVFLAAPNTTTIPTLELNGDASTLDVLTSQSLSGLDLSLGSPDSGAAGPASLVAGLGNADASVTLAAGVTLTQSNGFATLTGGGDGNSTLENDGQINAAIGGGLFSITGLANFANVGGITVANGGSLNVASTITNTGTIDDQASATFANAVNGIGTIMLSGNASVTFGGTVSAGQHVMLNDGLVVIGDPLAFAGTIDKFGTSDALWFPNETVNNPFYNNGTLSFTDASSDTIIIHLEDSVDSGAMQERTDGANGFFVGSPLDGALPCFVAGTRIATPDGEVAVERLAAGDRVRLADGGVAEIVWTGHRAVDVVRHPTPKKVWPVRVATDAFGPGLPRRDLYLSPDHAVFVDAVLIPVKYLINGDSIAQIPLDAVTYYHIELATHDVLLAEGLPAESYLDTGDRAALSPDNAVVALFPDFFSSRPAQYWEATGCAPLVIGGAALARVRAWIDSADRAAA